MSTQERVTLSEAIQIMIDAHMIDVHVSLPAQVDSFDASTQTVSVIPMLNSMIPDGSTPPNYTSEPLPKLVDVPVAFARGGGFFVSFPLKKGDEGMLVFAERSLAQWRATGNQSDPGDLGQHTLDGAWFVPAVASDARALNNVDADNLVIGSDLVGAARISITPQGEIDLGGSSSYVARADKVIDALLAIVQSLASAPTIPAEVGLVKVKADMAKLLLQTPGFTTIATTNTKVP